MVIKILPEQVPEYWDQIKFGALSVAGVAEKDRQLYCNGLLENLLNETHQAWLVVSEDRQIKAMGITRIMLDAGKIPYLLIDCAYGFTPATEADKDEVIETLLVFAKELKCSSVIAYTSNAMAVNAMRKMGMKEIHRLYQRII
jgi:hypothetical protein